MLYIVHTAAVQLQLFDAVTIQGSNKKWKNFKGGKKH